MALRIRGVPDPRTRRTGAPDGLYRREPAADASVAQRWGPPWNTLPSPF